MSHLFLAYILWYSVLDVNPLNIKQITERGTSRIQLVNGPAEVKRRHKQSQQQQQREYARVRDALVKVALQGLEQKAAMAKTLSSSTVASSSTAGSSAGPTTTLLDASSLEAESVVQLYLLGGGSSRTTPKAAGINPREALGTVVVQRIENAELYKAYSDQGCQPEDRWDRQRGSSPLRGSAGPPPFLDRNQRYREDIVWHGTRLKRMDGEGTSLAAKLQSIAENGFDPLRCEKGAHAGGGIWVASSPMGSFGHGCDGLVAFVLCLAKTHFNEWVDTNCARVLQRERVLPLYSLVHA
mmetsp:Transcript_19541/g.45441  ORF Transcript_19541/g.45441 Transcript_19541/m.45441 type:complete len:297 (+) Transcript_19541:3061-3951(+)